jgi:hypothetical protein
MKHPHPLILKISLFGLLAGLAWFGAVDGAMAQGIEYQPLENVPGFEAETKSGSFVRYVESIYSLGIWIVGICAMFMLAVGGFMYMASAGNNASVNTAKGVMWDSVIGLVLALVSWLILYVINPDLVNVSFSTLNVGGENVVPAAPSESVSGSSDPASGDTYTHSEAVKVLSSASIDVKSSGGCSDPDNSSCTSLEGIPKEAVARLIGLKEKSGCSFSVTGGTETGHKSHGKNLPRIDVAPEDCLGNFLYSNRSNLGSYGVYKICSTSRWQKISYNCGGYVEREPHIHLSL